MKFSCSIDLVHLSDEGARSTIFSGLAASGWYAAAITMKLLVEGELRPASGGVRLAFEELRSLRPMRPGDEPSVQSEILEIWPSRARLDQGLIKVHSSTSNQAGEAVQIAVANLLVPRRPDSDHRRPV